MLFPIKSSNEVLQEMMEEVLANTKITDMTEGSVARTLLEVFNRRLNEAYRYLDIYTSMSFLSTARGVYLDMIGSMLACDRRPNEDDDNYRYRISRQVFSAAAANRTSIRLRCLSIPGVKNVVITPYSRGNGSFTVHIITDEIDTPDEILTQAESIVQEAKAEGIMAIVAKPTIVPIDIGFNVIPTQNVSASETTLAAQIKEVLSNYIDTIPMGGTVSISELVRIAHTVEGVSQAYVNSLYIDGKATIIGTTYQLDWDERAYMRAITVIK